VVPVVATSAAAHSATTVTSDLATGRRVRVREQRRMGSPLRANVARDLIDADHSSKRRALP
jgi:hypothetical protein